MGSGFGLITVLEWLRSFNLVLRQPIKNRSNRKLQKKKSVPDPIMKSPRNIHLKTIHAKKTNGVGCFIVIPLERNSLINDKTKTNDFNKDNSKLSKLGRTMAELTVFTSALM